MGLGSRCRRKTLTTHKSGFQPRFSSPVPFFLETEGKVPARRPVRSSLLPSKLSVTMSVDPCGSFPRRPAAALPSACTTRHVSACGQALALALPRCARASVHRQGDRPRRGPALCLEEGDVGLTCQPACPPRHQLLFYELCAYIKSGSPPEGLLPPGPAHSPRSSHSSVSGIRNRVRIS